MPCRDAEARAQLLLGRAVQRAVEDQPHGPADELGPGPGHGLRPAIRPALEAGPIPRSLRRRRQRILRHVPSVRPAAAARPAVDPRRHDRRERSHAGGIAVGTRADWTDSDAPATWPDL